MLGIIGFSYRISTIYFPQYFARRHSKRQFPILDIIPVRFMASTTTKVPNRLSKEKSPYLLQHQYNPVDWYPWGDDAIDKARKEDKPIFLSVGYSTCHWCHVMEHTCFEVQAVADILNQSFVSIKVDREERPDVDNVYMSYILMSTGHGGWPMSVFLEPTSLSPFFGGTYWTAYGENNRPGFIQILETIRGLWKSDRQKVDRSSSKIIDLMQRMSSKSESSQFKATQSERVKVLEQLGSLCYNSAFSRKRSFDEKYGGWGGAPKFPQPVILQNLFCAIAIQGKFNESFLEQLESTLTNMYTGGIHDHLGGGFHRYSVTADWKLPHFEKMLYDQPQLANAYINAYLITRNQLYADAAHDIYAYVQRCLTDPHSGAFWSAEDADSPLQENPQVKREGAFYVWTFDELQNILAEDELKVAVSMFGVSEDGNVPSEHDPHGELTHQNILHTIRDIESTAKDIGATTQVVEKALSSLKRKLFEAQSKRPKPHLDDKIILSWNSMMIGSLAQASRIFQNSDYLKRALRALEFIKKDMYSKEKGTLFRSYRLGPSDVEAFAEDYANLIAALIEVYYTTFDTEHLKLATQLQEKMDALFWDTEHGGYFRDSGNPALNLLVRTKDDYDGSEPSYNSIAAHNLIHLSHLLENSRYKQRVEDLFMAFSKDLIHASSALPMMTIAGAIYEKPYTLVLIYGQSAEMINTIFKFYDPFRIVIQVDPGSPHEQFFRDHGVQLLSDPSKNLLIDGKPAAYICQNYTCQTPVTDADQLQSILSKCLAYHSNTL